MGQIYSTQSPYPPIGAAALCEGCPVTVASQAQNWTWTPQDDQGWTLALDGWYAVPNDFNESVVVSQERSQIWNVGWADDDSSNDGPLNFNVSLPGNNNLLYWTITGTGNGTTVQLLGDGSSDPAWYQMFSTPSPPTQ